MKKILYIRPDLLVQAGLADEELTGWEKEKLIRPDGISDEGVPFYTVVTVQKIQQIKKLEELGYALVDIQKIIRKVGLPLDQSKGTKGKKVSEFLTVGGLAERVGVSPRTIKHWEDKGIIESDMRSEGGFRLYSEVYVNLCQLIKDLQLFGFSLEDIKGMADQYREFLAMRGDPGLFSTGSREKKLTGMTEQLRSVQAKIDSYREAISRWEDLLKKNKKDLVGLRSQPGKRDKKGKEKNA
jgi:DNA-binding transcriptional MerR regulator